MEKAPEVKALHQLTRVQVCLNEPWRAATWDIPHSPDAIKPLCQRRGVPAPNPLKATSVPELMELLQELIVWAGSPSYRALAIRAKVPKSTIFDMVKHLDSLPPYEVLFAVVKACGAEADWRRWAEARRRVSKSTRQVGVARFYKVPTEWLYAMGQVA